MESGSIAKWLKQEGDQVRIPLPLRPFRKHCLQRGARLRRVP